MRSWALRSATSSTSVSAAGAGSFGRPVARSSATRASSWCTVWVRNAALNRESTRSGNTSESWSSAARGRSRRATSATNSTRVAKRLSPIHHTSVRTRPGGRAITLERRCVANAESAIGATKTTALTANAARGRPAQRCSSRVRSGLGTSTSCSHRHGGRHGEHPPDRYRPQSRRARRTAGLGCVSCRSSRRARLGHRS